MLSTRPPFPETGEPMVRGIVLHTFREALMAIGGAAALASMAPHLERDAAALLEAGVSSLTWQPERILIAWYEALWRGPAAQADAVVAAYVDRAMDLSFGRTRRALLHFATPARLVARAALLWRHDHSHGSLVVETLDAGPRVIVGKLRDHPYVASRVARNAVAESFRHVIGLTGARNVKEAHALEGITAMTMRFSWD